MSALTRRLHLAAAVVGGALVGLSLPPLGVWAMGVVGVALIAWALADRSAGKRLALGMLAGVGQFSISLAWSLQFNTAGYVALTIVESAFIAIACVLVPPGRGRLPALAGMFVLAELARESWPFGGLPLGGLALGQLDGPVALVARLGGPLLIVGVTVLAGAGLGAMLPAARSPASHRFGDSGPAIARRIAGAVGLLVAAVLTVVGALAPNGMDGGRDNLRVAIVQGGGKRGLNQLQVPPSLVFNAAIRATTAVDPGPHLILWPEDVVGLGTSFVGSSAEKTLAAIARAHGATLFAGVTYPVGATQFRNEIVAFSPSGALVSTFEKVHRVPFGEYVPDRGFFQHFANLSAVPRDAIAGHGSGLMVTPAARVAVLVSYEVFFADRGRSGVRAGGRIILVPTNTSSYSSSQAPAQEIAASRMQAIEEGRYVLQAAPTGYSAVINNDGDVLRRTPLSSRSIIVATVPLLSGSTWYERFGDLPVVIAAAAAVVAGWLLALASRRQAAR